MIAMTDYQWVFVGLMIACYLAICFRTAMRMARTGRNLWKWLAITVLLTSIPATVVLLRDQVRRGPLRRGGVGARCPECGMRLDEMPPYTHDDGTDRCPHCHAAVHEASGR